MLPPASDGHDAPSPRPTPEDPDRPAASAGSDVLSGLVRIVTERAGRLGEATPRDPRAMDALREAVDALGHYLDALDLLRAAGIAIARPRAKRDERPRAEPDEPPRAEPDEPPRVEPDEPPRVEPDEPPRVEPDEPPRVRAAAPLPAAPEAGGEPAPGPGPEPSPGSPAAASRPEPGVDPRADEPGQPRADGGREPPESRGDERPAPGAPNDAHAPAVPGERPVPGATGERPVPGATGEGPMRDDAAGSPIPDVPDEDRTAPAAARRASGRVPDAPALAQPDRRYPAFRDATTGLLSREGFEWIASGELKRCARHGRVFSILLLELGASEPETLQRSAEVVRRVLRGSDVAAREAERAVVVALPETAQQEARAVGERLLAELEGASAWGREARIGMAAYPMHGETVWSLLETARGKLSLPVGNVLQRGGDGGYWSG